MEAKVLVSSDSKLQPDTSGAARIHGYYYNSQRGPGSGQAHNQYEGNVFAQIRLQYYSDTTLKARALVDRSNNSDETDWTTLYDQDFPVAIFLDTYYTLSIRYTGSHLIFKCNNETLSFPIATPAYPAFDEFRGIGTRIMLDPGEFGYVEAKFDDVYIERKADAVTSIPILLLSDE